MRIAVCWLENVRAFELAHRIGHWILKFESFNDRSLLLHNLTEYLNARREFLSLRSTLPTTQTRYKMTIKRSCSMYSSLNIDAYSRTPTESDSMLMHQLSSLKLDKSSALFQMTVNSLGSIVSVGEAQIRRSRSIVGISNISKQPQSRLSVTSNAQIRRSPTAPISIEPTHKRVVRFNPVVTVFEWWKHWSKSTPQTVWEMHSCWWTTRLQAH